MAKYWWNDSAEQIQIISTRVLSAMIGEEDEALLTW